MAQDWSAVPWRAVALGAAGLVVWAWIMLFRFRVWQLSRTFRRIRVLPRTEWNQTPTATRPPAD